MLEFWLFKQTFTNRKKVNKQWRRLFAELLRLFHCLTTLFSSVFNLFSFITFFHLSFHNISRDFQTPVSIWNFISVFFWFKLKYSSTGWLFSLKYLRDIRDQLMLYLLYKREIRKWTKGLLTIFIVDSQYIADKQVCWGSF